MLQWRIKRKRSDCDLMCVPFSDCLYFSGESIQCYECNSHDDQRCADNIPPDEFKRECPINTQEHQAADFTLCRKIKQTIDFTVNGRKMSKHRLQLGLLSNWKFAVMGDTRVIRTCGWDRTSYVGRCYHRSGFGGRQEVCTCEQELCNSSSLILASFPLISAMFVLLKLYLWIQVLL